ncbi:MAG TPA: DUF4865 family protein [Aliidongia sp.]|uniref:DUF4865 family protein n=1 Tax=Aliidongia sp. TaxID=1914230 RepID=UPI002DDDB6DA|nr:DUF4865 family protein [Aliidongia sp.]HEV2677749.1 DUF4865 family protein [Aliidongia sp.]
MFAMQYTIPLPADYDMAIIRRRVAEKGHLLDDFPGLGVKAYLIRERGVAGADRNEYAPFYLWPQIQSIWPFVAGPGFKGLTESFGWVSVRSWAGLDVSIRPDFDGRTIVAASRQLMPVAPATDLAALRRAEADRQAELTERSDGPALHAVALDIERWQLARFALWTGEDQQAKREESGVPIEHYRALHLSTPDLGSLKASTEPAT